MSGDKKLILYVSKLSGSSKMRKQQEYIERILTGKSIPVKLVDITDTNNEKDKKFMRENAKSDGKTPLPPQLFLDDEYISNYDTFFEAVETDSLYDLLKMPKKSEPGDSDVGKGDD